MWNSIHRLLSFWGCLLHSYLELKAGDNKPTEEQRKWLEHLGNVGYLATWCTGWEAARDVIVDYLNLEVA